ncbi:ATP-binding protein [Tumebacillus avium]|nr:ATP-binding protein [Tumebacillus avium]
MEEALVRFLGMYNVSLMLLTVQIAMISAYAVIDLSERVAASSGKLCRMWMLAGAAAMGFGTWTVHLIGLLACNVPMSDSYDFWKLGLSMLMAVLSSFLVLCLVKRRKGNSKFRFLLAALIYAGGTILTSFLCLQAVQAGDHLPYDLKAAAFTLLYATPVLYAIFLFAFRYQERKRLGKRPHKIISAVLMGFAVASVHYVQQIGFNMHPAARSNTHHVTSSDGILLAFSLGIAALLIQFLVLLGALIDRRAAMHSARMSEQRFRSLFAHNPYAVFSIDLEGSVIDANGAAELMLGLRRDEMLGNLYKWIDDPETVRLIGDRLQESLEGETPNYECNVRLGNGSEISLLVTNVPLIVDGRILGAYLIAKDITEQRRTQELLHRSDKLTAIGQLAAGIAHEIRNPLTAIKGFTQLLKERAQHNVEYYDVILSELDRANLIVGEFLLLAKPQLAEFRPASLEQILLLIITLLEPEANLHDVRIRMRFEPVPDVFIEENQIKQVLLNLLQNAIEAMPDGGELTIELASFGADQIRLRLVDQGNGMSEEQLQKLGDPFFSTKEKGTGLGLMVSFKIIEDHGGKLNITSVVGVGTTIDLLLPVT